MQIIDGIPVFGEADENTLAQMRTAVRGAARGALMADNHLGYSVPIGGVLAYDEAISPSGVGYDIACGNKAVKTNIHFRSFDEPRAWVHEWMDKIAKTVSFGIGRTNAETVDHELFYDDPAWQIPAVAKLRDKAADQLGTVGSGNHYVDLFEDEDGYLWIGVHFGSRGFGHGIAVHYLQAGGADNGMMAEPLVLATKSDLGSEYLEAMRLAGRYAYAGRDWVVNRVASLIGAQIVESVHNHHNYAWPEMHEGRQMWVVRKGATPAFPGQRGFIGGSMGDNAVIVEGVGQGAHGEVSNFEQQMALFSTVHGAGRVMSRTDATGKNRRGRQIRPARITHAEMSAWIISKGLVLRGAGLDEAPQAYKRLPEVLAHHAATIRVLHTLRPLGVAMAGSDIHDPYND